MKNLKNKTKRVLSLGLALLMVVSTMFVGGIQAKADTGTTYEPYYDAETETVVGLPETGTVLAPTDIIRGADSFTDTTSIAINVYSFKEEIGEDGYHPTRYVNRGEEVTIGTLRPVIGSADEGFTIESVDYWEYGTDIVYKEIVINLCAVDQGVKLENLTLELDWSKVEAEIGGILSPDNFTNGFIKNEEIVDTSASLFECIYITKPDGTMEYDETCTINADDSYRFELVYYVADGYYFSAEGNDIALEDSLVDSVFHWGYSSNVWDDQVSLVFEFTGAELVEKVESANNPSTPETPPTGGDDNSDPEVPPTEENEKIELKPNAQAGPQNMTHGLSLKTFENAINEIFMDYYASLMIGRIEKGSEVHGLATGTAQYVEGGVHITISNDATVYVVKINDKTKADMIGECFDDLEYYAENENKYYLYNEGEYVVWISISEEANKVGLTRDFIKSYIDAYYEKATSVNDYTAKLEDNTEIAEKIELSDLEKTYMEATGAELEVILDFKEVGTTATTEEQKAIEKELGSKKVGTFLEIDLTKKIGEYEAKVTETTGAVAITFELPAELKAENRTYYVVRYHDGKVDILDAKYDAEKGTITFETDKFSTYAVVYEDVAVKAPATGDTTNVALYVMLLVCGAGVLVASRKMNRI